MRYLVIAIITLCMVGCAGLRKDLIQISKEDMKNAETTRIVAKNMLLSWKLNSGYLRGVMGDRILELPSSALKAIQELDILAEKQNLSDYELGYSVGLRVKLLGHLVENAIKEVAPDLIRYLPIAF